MYLKIFDNTWNFEKWIFEFLKNTPTCISFYETIKTKLLSNMPLTLAYKNKITVTPVLFSRKRVINDLIGNKINMSISIMLNKRRLMIDVNLHCICELMINPKMRRNEYWYNPENT